ncbi:hypothetical protein ACVXHA_28140 [Escherichia coli]
MIVKLFDTSRTSPAAFHRSQTNAASTSRQVNRPQIRTGTVTGDMRRKKSPNASQPL